MICWEKKAWPITPLGLTLSSKTQTQRLDLAGRGLFRAVDGPAGSSADFADPRLSFGYTRTGANSAFSADAALSSSEIGFLRPFEDFLDAGGVFVPPDDLDDLQGTGTRLSRSLAFELALGQEGPFGATFSTAISDLRYRDTSAADLVDTRRSSLGVDLRFALSEVAEATLGLGYDRLEADEAADRETTDLGLDLALDAPRGTLTFAAFAAEAPEGIRFGLEAGRSYDLPRGRLTFSLGATRDAAGETALTGNFGYLQELSEDSALQLSARRSVGSGNDGERLVTSLSADYSRPLTALIGLDFDAAFVRSEDTGTATTTDTVSLGTSLGYTLAQDWSLNLGYRYQMRDETGDGSAADNALFLSLQRSFTNRP